MNFPIQYGMCRTNTDTFSLNTLKRVSVRLYLLHGAISTIVIVLLPMLLIIHPILSASLKYGSSSPFTSIAKAILKITLVANLKKLSAILPHRLFYGESTARGNYATSLDIFQCPSPSYEHTSAGHFDTPNCCVVKESSRTPF
jgi:hypothetical protein